MLDEIVEAVRRAREEYAAKFDFDLEAICADLRRKQKLDGGGAVVTLPKCLPIATVAIEDKEMEG